MTPAGFFASALLGLSLLAPPHHATSVLPHPPRQKPLSASILKDELYEELAGRWLEREGVSADRLQRSGMEPVLAERLLRVELGAFDVFVPVGTFADGKRTETTGAALAALVEVQLQWGRWFPGTEVEGLEKAGTELARWLGNLRPRDLGDPEALRGQELFADLGAAETVREPAGLFRRLMLAGGPLPIATDTPAARVVLMPAREDFVEFLCAVGLSRSYLRSGFWVESNVDWTAFDFDGTRVVALEYATHRARQDYRPGIAMDSKNPRALTAQVAQLGARSLFERTFGDRMEPMLAGGLANELVIDLCGEVDTRSDGDTRSREASARSVFIPGGNPDGGYLPANNADSRWRESKGKDHFVRVLEKAQKEGGKKARERWAKLASFTVLDDTLSKKYEAVAPFLGPSSAASPPAAFVADNAEFLRAYRAAFLYWLRVHAEGKKDSAARFAELLGRLGDPRASTDLARLLEETYGRPLSAATGEALFEEDTLEGQFLRWLSKH